MSLTNAELAILGLVAEAPSHGYEIERRIEERGMREWTEIGFSSIYFLLKKLTARGLVEQGPVDSTNPRARKTFRLTGAGVALHAEETRRAIAEPRPVFPALLVGLANWPALAPGAATTALDERNATLSAELTRLREKRAAGELLPPFVAAMFDYSLAMIEAECAWLEKARKTLEETDMEKIDFRKTMKKLYGPPAGRFEVIDVPAMNFFMVDGHGDPNKATAYKEAVEALYSASYTLKFMCKKELSRDYTVPPLEGLWWADDMESFITREKDKWSWTMMIMVPDFIDRPTALRAVAEAGKKKDLPALSKLRFERLEEGKSVQTMHIGSYDEEGPTLKRLHQEFLPQNGLIETGHHHEIYLGDPRKTAPEKLKTVLRQPVKAR
jgi:DNA-binding PadR family transcriptional regulator